VLVPLAVAWSGSGLVWLLIFQAAFFLFWHRRRSRVGSAFAHRFGQLLALLLSENPAAKGTGESRGQGMSRALMQVRALSRLSRSARRWRGQLEAMYAQGYQAVSETISSPAVGQGGLVRAAVEALRTERSRGGANPRTTMDPVVVLAYGLGAWPAAADLTSLEQLLAELGISQRELRNRFDSMTHTAVSANQSRDFHELAGASFVLGASARIVEAATAPGPSVPPPASSALPTRSGSARARPRAQARKHDQ
jgi:hypothetical protein